MRWAELGGDPDGEPVEDEDREVSLVEREMQMLPALAAMPFVDTLELAVILGEAYATVHRILSRPARRRRRRTRQPQDRPPADEREGWFLMAEGIGEASVELGFATPSGFVRPYPVRSSG